MRLIVLMNILEKKQNEKEEKLLTYQNTDDFLKEEEKFLIVLKAKYFQQENRLKEKELKYNPETNIQRLSITLTQVKAGNTSEYSV